MGERKQPSRLESFARPKRRKSLIIHLIILLMLVFLMIPIIYEVTQDNAELNRTRVSLNATSDELKNINIENEQLERYANGENFDEYLERFARDEMGFADPQERVFHVRPGN